MAASAARNIVLIVHYFPPINSSGAKRMEAMAKFFTRAGRRVTVIAPTKTPSDGAFTEQVPEGVDLIELDWLGRLRPSHGAPADDAGRASGRGFKDLVMRWFGQLPDPRLPFAFGFLSPVLDHNARRALREADVVVATCPPWSILLAGRFAGWRFRKPVVLDYRDQFSYCHEMPGSRAAKWLEAVVDRALTRRAAAVVAISEPMADYYRSFHSDVSVILNGYDPERMDAARATASWTPRPEGTPLVVRYLGIITAGRIPHHLLKALTQLQTEGRIDPGTVRFEFYGDCKLLEQIVARDHAGIAGMFHFLPKVPYARSLELAATADHLLFCENAVPPKAGQAKSASGILTTKLFEYLASGRPVIADIADDTLAGGMILRAGKHHFVADTVPAFVDFLASERFWAPGASIDEPFVRALSRASQADQYLAKLDSLGSGTPASPAG